MTIPKTSANASILRRTKSRLDAWRRAHGCGWASTRASECVDVTSMFSIAVSPPDENHTQRRGTTRKHSCGVPRSVAENGRTGVESPGVVEAPPGGGDVPELGLDPRLNEPQLPVVPRPRDRAGDPEA